MSKEIIINNESKALQIRSVALMKKRKEDVKFAAIAVSCFSLFFLIGYIGTFLIFKF